MTRLRELYPMLHDAIPGILANCASSVEPENRDRFIYGSLRRLIRCRLAEQVFGPVSPNDLIYIEEVTRIPTRCRRLIVSGNSPLPDARTSQM